MISTCLPGAKRKGREETVPCNCTNHNLQKFIKKIVIFSVSKKIRERAFPAGLRAVDHARAGLTGHWTFRAEQAV
jgi:hypothetical protein